MTDASYDHLSDDVLNEYLDGALGADQRGAAGTHLAGCPACAARLAELRSLYVRLESMPDAPLARDLAPAVVRAVRQASSGHRLPVTSRRGGAFWLFFSLQVMAALALLAFAWPYLSAWWADAPWPDQWSWIADAGPAAARLKDLLARAPELLTISADSADLLARVWRWLETFRVAAEQGVVFDVAPVELGLAVAAAGALWVVGNAVLLRPIPPPRSRRL